VRLEAKRTAEFRSGLVENLGRRLGLAGFQLGDLRLTDPAANVGGATVYRVSEAGRQLDEERVAGNGTKACGDTGPEPESRVDPLEVFAASVD
jgi:hypothetical protein